MHSGMGENKMASERARWSYFSPHFVKNISRGFILKTEARREYYYHV